MPMDNKDSIAKKIIDFTVFESKHMEVTSTSMERPVSATSPTDQDTKQKKANLEVNRKMENTDKMRTQSNQQTAGLKDLLTPLIEEVCSLKENMDRNYNRLDEKYTKLESRLDEKYTQLENAISTQNNDSSKDFKDLQQQNGIQQNRHEFNYGGKQKVKTAV